ncbi:DUF2577 domain-containing protein [Mesobacillus stamsii]|uniref:DUF2577 domain-containing protein n=1 Tax=Mesobacillus stamsii TaxID=225347 RepID=A0ABU0FS53_9BACI|nr:DUF2577 domain-containing protein [Mesobacillus stamsii]MDQ0412731.1 hypothetical protein [Mesobacillus stamsii]
MSLVDLIKRTALKAVAATNPVEHTFGVVKTISPLSVEIHSKLTLPEEFLVVSEHLTVHERNVIINNSAEAVVMKFNDGLKPGDKVILSRVQGGHQYIVIDRYKGG